MRILVVTATDKEIAPLVSQLAEKSNAGPRLKTYLHQQHEIHVLTTGVGMVATAAWCARVLTQIRYDIAFNFGVCGSFHSELEPGQVVHVVSDCLAELGAEHDEAFLTIQELNLLGADAFPFESGRLSNLHPPKNSTLNGLKTVSGITVNTAHGNERTIAAVTQRYQPDVESMEGAAFMYACLINEVVFAQVRAVSNIVERRNRNAWKMTEAIGNLGSVALRILEDA